MKSYNCFEFQTKNFIIRYKAKEEKYPEDVLSALSYDLPSRIKLKIENGELLCFSVDIYVIFKDTHEVLGSASLFGNIHDNYKDFMDHYGLGYTSIVNKINNSKKGENIDDLNYALDKIKENGYTPFGSYFKDLVKEAIEEAKSTRRYKKLIELKNKKEKIENF